MRRRRKNDVFGVTRWNSAKNGKSVTHGANGFVWRAGGHHGLYSIWANSEAASEATSVATSECAI